MTERDDLGHEPEETHDKDFAPVTRGGDARGRTVSSSDQPSPDKEDVSGTGVPGVRKPHPDSGPSDEEGVRQAEEDDATRLYPGNG
jgi:hypothetical protein